MVVVGGYVVVVCGYVDDGVGVYKDVWVWLIVLVRLLVMKVGGSVWVVLL